MRIRWFARIGPALGWCAQVPTDLTADKDAGSLKNIIVLARKRPIQEGIVEKLDFSRVFGNYVTGPDRSGLPRPRRTYDDIATSDRQRLIEDDERVRRSRRSCAGRSSRPPTSGPNSGPKKQARTSSRRYPKIKRVGRRAPEPWQRDVAEKMIGTIAALSSKQGRGATADLFRCRHPRLRAGRAAKGVRGAG